MSSAEHPLSYLTSIAGDTIMESIVLAFEFCKEGSHRHCVVVQFIQKPSFSYVY